MKNSKFLFILLSVSCVFLLDLEQVFGASFRKVYFLTGFERIKSCNFVIKNKALVSQKVSFIIYGKATSDHKDLAANLVFSNFPLEYSDSDKKTGFSDVIIPAGASQAQSVDFSDIGSMVKADSDIFKVVFGYITAQNSDATEAINGSLEAHAECFVHREEDNSGVFYLSINGGEAF